ncbi:Photosystem I reaction center subunit II [Hibiscus syriacus]|uniref:Photosystem I reaction center subunit II, chloroplastic n=1 Tax=Hibiscus syriacus TaxID=106335 RepID=A0A6A3AFH0_HIBSY|nr:Photosystem I reaction center subunit II [Hibiscus syriacus]
MEAITTIKTPHLQVPETYHHQGQSNREEIRLDDCDKAPVGFTPPKLDPNTRHRSSEAARVDFYVRPIMRQGPNLLKLARKEQCLALGTRLRSKYNIKYLFYRVFPNGEVQYLHPKDGVYPEKVNPGRQGVGQNFRSIGKNVSPIEVKFTGKQVYDL